MGVREPGLYWALITGAGSHTSQKNMRSFVIDFDVMKKANEENCEAEDLQPFECEKARMYFSLEEKGVDKSYSRLNLDFGWNGSFSDPKFLKFDAENPWVKLVTNGWKDDTKPGEGCWWQLPHWAGGRTPIDESEEETFARQYRQYQKSEGDGVTEEDLAGNVPLAPEPEENEGPTAEEQAESDKEERIKENLQREREENEG